MYKSLFAEERKAVSVEYSYVVNVVLGTSKSGKNAADFVGHQTYLGTAAAKATEAIVQNLRHGVSRQVLYSNVRCDSRRASVWSILYQK